MEGIAIYEVRQINRNVSVVTILYNSSLEQSFLLTADRHWDNPMSNHELQKRHLTQAKKKHAGVIDIGDFFCAMQGKFDKRGKKGDLRPEHKVDDYLDALVRTASDFFEPFARQFIVIGMGNHETGILKHHETNLTSNLVVELNRRTGSTVYNGGYSGWVVFKFINTRTKEVQIRKLWYIHGYGGGGPVTRGVIQTNRKAVYLPDADIVLSGHTHDEWVMPIGRVKLDSEHRVVHDEQVHVQIPTYKDEYKDGFEGFHIEKGRPPKPVGAIWLTFKKEDRHSPISFDFTRAK